MTIIQILTWFGSSLGARVLTSLGIGFLSFAAVTAAANTLVTSFASNWASMSPIILNLLSLAGFPQAFGWIIGGMLAKLSLNSLQKLGKLP